MAENKDDRYYAVADEKPKGLSKDDYEVAQDKLAAKAEGVEYVAPDLRDAEVVATDRPAADAPTIAETQKDEQPVKKSAAKK